MAKRITTVTDYFVRENIAHNLSIARSTALMTKKPFNGKQSRDLVNEWRTIT